MKGTIINKSLNMGANLSSLSRAETKLTKGSDEVDGEYWSGEWRNENG